VTATATTFSTRQRVLLTAAVRVLARSGMRGLTHRAVDAEADLPQGSCSAYMRTRVALLIRLTEFVTAHFARDIEELTLRIEGHRGVDDGYAVRQTTAMLRSWLLEPEMLLARVELSLEGYRQPEIAAIIRTELRELENIVDHVMTSKGHEHSRARATTLIAAIDGVLMHALREKPENRAAYLRDSMALLMGALVGVDQQTGLS
jgi:DNA-binding transcriptional regulator YbjK